MVRVTVVMAAYNAADTISDSIESIIGQTFRDWELIVVDDHSSDRTWQILERYIGDSRIRVIRLPENCGGAGARSAAINCSTSDLIAVQDADDISEPERLQIQVSEFDQDPDLAVVSGQLVEFGAWGGPECSYSWPVESTQIASRLQEGRSPLADCAAMFKRSSFYRAGGYDPILRRVYDLGLYLAMRHEKFVSVPGTLVRYRTNRPVSFRYCITEGRYRDLAIRRVLRGSSSTSQKPFPRVIATDLKSAVSFLIRRFREL